MTCIVFSVSLYKIFRLVTASGWSLPIFGGGGSVSGGFYYIRVPTWEMVLPIFGGGGQCQVVATIYMRTWEMVY